ncbi:MULTISPECIES: IscS subfamily cysteine desulfurase [unclassified Bacillus (in: firmicutes)]|uniref:IscS subfamily cysteine desulfurase n=1 Tax=unclassified Bacillus (in: firmicutes) TaxID=185979 RepID=UPI0008F09094|nr:MULTISPECIES: IscS subfamily cysteine desulfurase [unclassified Bacillus (in: firmicutes)]SFB15999.1 cysteine desulfurase [Bacillus sp. UNCCL13]SFQ78378.1 cysteine desulfurase [Bacillus sp. cl95]
MKYFDFAATCPLDPEAAETYIQTATHYFGNTSSLHDTGENANSLLELCRNELAEMIGVLPEGVYFTSGGTESNFLALESIARGASIKGNHIVTGAAEHSSVHSVMTRLKNDGYEITFLPLTSKGMIDLNQLRGAMREDTILVSIQHANSEIGTIQPLKEISAICKERNILLHSDCVQSFGKIDLKSIIPYVDSLSISGHKVYGPKGIGAVYIHPEVPWSPLFPGSSHENGLRPGTVNVPAIAAMITAIQHLSAQKEELSLRFTNLRQSFLQALQPIEPLLTVHGAEDIHEQLPSILGLSIRGLEGQWLMLECNRKGYAISTGTACHTGMLSPSKTMKSLGYDDKTAKEFIRISFGCSTTENDVKNLANTIVSIAQASSSFNSFKKPEILW